MAATPDFKESLEFLLWWKPAGPWVLCAFSPDRDDPSSSAGAFGPDDSEALERWLAAQDAAGRNVYYHVNTAWPGLEKKAEKSDIVSVDWFHVDVDPRAGEDIDAERDRILTKLLNPDNGVYPPSVVVFSGGGYQAFWRLSNPIEIQGRSEDVARSECFNKQLEMLFGGDNCFNVDRIMRLPGTLNFPNEKKRRKGQVVVRAEVVERHDSRIYSTEDFTPAQMIKSHRGEASQQTVEISGNVPRISSMEDLDKASTTGPLPDWVKLVIVQGIDPMSPYKHESRSEWQHAVSCALVRAGIPDEMHYAVLTDPDLGISESILDKGSRTHDYAVRQIVRAKEVAISPELAGMNEKHAVVGNWGGRCRVMQEIWDPSVGRYRLTKQSFEDLRNRYCHQHVEAGKDAQGKVVRLPIGHWWLKHPMRRTYESIVFVPEGDGGAQNYNLWHGFAVDPRPGDWSLFEDHLRNVICRGEEEHYQYLLNWFAYAVQHPDRPGYSAVVMRGGHGVGKGVVAKEFGALWGRHFLHVSSPSHVVGNFNAHLRDCCVLFADEAFYAGDKKHRSTLKALITEDTLMIEGKGIDSEFGRNYVHLIMASNEDWVVGAERGDRRFFVLDVSDSHKEDATYFRAMLAQMEDGGRAAFLHHLVNMDLSEFNVRHVPKTDALRHQQAQSLSPDLAWWYEKLVDGCLLARHGIWEERVWRHDLVYDYCQTLRNASRWGSQSGAAGSLGVFLKSVLPEGWPKGRRHRNTVKGKDIFGYECAFARPSDWVFPPLEVCRQHWEGMYGPQDWPEPPENAPDDPEDDGIF